MAKVYQCDRCKAVFKEPSFKRKLGTYEGVMKYLTACEVEGHLFEEIHLCDQCWSEFYNMFMKNRHFEGYIGGENNG